MEPTGPPPIVLVLADDESEDGWLQPLAGGLIWTARPLAAGAQRALRPSIDCGGIEPGPDWSVIYDGPGWIDGGLHRLQSLLSSRGERRVDFEDGERFHIDTAGHSVRRESSRPADDRSLERALGAPMALALALRGIYLLHASAVARRRASGEFAGAIAFTANSGAGKSTLAAAANRTVGKEWVRIADDQLPVRLGPPASALPHFPQLKLTREEGYPASARTELPLVQLIEIEHSPDFLSIEIERLDAASACLALVRATVAAKLFDADLLGRHFEACAAAGSCLPAYRLRFPTGLEHLRAVLANLTATAALAQP